MIQPSSLIYYTLSRIPFLLLQNKREGGRKKGRDWEERRDTDLISLWSIIEWLLLVWQKVHEYFKNILFPLISFLGSVNVTVNLFMKIHTLFISISTSFATLNLFLFILFGFLLSLNLYISHSSNTFSSFYFKKSANMGIHRFAD